MAQFGKRDNITTALLLKICNALDLICRTSWNWSRKRTRWNKGRLLWHFYKI